MPMPTPMPTPTPMPMPTPTPMPYHTNTTNRIANTKTLLDIYKFQHVHSGKCYNSSLPTSNYNCFGPFRIFKMLTVKYFLGY